MSLKVRVASLDDVVQIAQIHVDSWAYAYTGLMPQSYIESYTLAKRQQLWANIIGRKLAQVLVADCGGVLVGFLCFGQPKDLAGTQNYELSSIYLHPEKIGLGIGQVLYDECEKMLQVRQAKRIVVWALDGNERALNFYVKQGFTRTGNVSEECSDNLVLTDIELVKTWAAG